MPMSISQADFTRLTQFIKTNYGIDLSQKRELITGRLSTTLQGMGYSEYGSFIDHLLKERHTDDVELVLNKLTTNYTFFMREKEHYNFFQNTILPDIVARHARDKVLSIWSAGCSTGEEPYNISMYLMDYLGARAGEWDTRILATDISQRALTEAQRGIYDLPDTIPQDWKRKYFVPEGSTGHYKVAPRIRDNVLFRTFNLMDPIRFRLKFDVIFCRNVMIYFDQTTKDALVSRFYDATVPGGYLLIGHSETINRTNVGYQFLAPATFRKR